MFIDYENSNCNKFKSWIDTTRRKSTKYILYLDDMYLVTGLYTIMVKHEHILIASREKSTFAIRKFTPQIQMVHNVFSAQDLLHNLHNWFEHLCQSWKPTISQGESSFSHSQTKYNLSISVQYFHLIIFAAPETEWTTACNSDWIPFSNCFFWFCVEHFSFMNFHHIPFLFSSICVSLDCFSHTRKFQSTRRLESIGQLPNKMENWQEMRSSEYLSMFSCISCTPHNSTCATISFSFSSAVAVSHRFSVYFSAGIEEIFDKIRNWNINMSEIWNGVTIKVCVLYEYAERKKFRIYNNLWSYLLPKMKPVSVREKKNEAKRNETKQWTE